MVSSEVRKSAKKGAERIEKGGRVKRAERVNVRRRATRSLDVDHLDRPRILLASTHALKRTAHDPRPRPRPLGHRLWIALVLARSRPRRRPLRAPDVARRDDQHLGTRVARQAHHRRGECRSSGRLSLQKSVVRLTTCLFVALSSLVSVTSTHVPRVPPASRDLPRLSPSHCLTSSFPSRHQRSTFLLLCRPPSSPSSLQSDSRRLPRSRGRTRS